jgi:6-phosphofructokinase 1
VKISKISNPQKYEKIKSNLQKHQIDGLIIAGGDDTGSVVLDLVEKQIKCIHIPKTMDLDLQTYSVGGDSTIWRIAKFMNDLRTTTQTHNRVLILEVFGRYAGHTAFRGGVGADADCILIPEIGVDFEVVYNHFKEKFTERLQNSDYKATNYSIVVAEGMKGKDGNYFADETSGTDSFGHQKLGGIGAYVKQILQDFSKKDSEYWKEVYAKNGVYVDGINILPEIRDILPGHLVRCGESTPYDISFGKQCGGSAVQLLLNGISGVTVAGLNEGEIRYIPIKKAIEQRYVNLQDIEFYENLGICFGRTVNKNYLPKFKEITDRIERYM